MAERHPSDKGTSARLMMVAAFLSGALALSDTFVTPYLWVSHVATAHIMLFAAVQFLAMSGVFWWSITRRLPIHRGLSLGVLLIIAYLLAVALAGAALRRWVYAVGALAGTGFGFFWQAFYVGAADYVPEEQRDQFSGNVGMVETVAALLGPVAGASLITAVRPPGGYGLVFLVSVAGLLPAGLGALSFRSAKPHRDRGRETAGRIPQRTWRALLLANAGRGMSEVAITALPPLYLFEVTHSVWLTGALGSVSALSGLVGFRISGRLSRPDNRRLGSWVSVVTIGVGALLLAILPPGVGLWPFVVLAAAAAAVQRVAVESCALDVITLIPVRQEQRTAVKEVVLNLARALLLIGVFVLVLRLGGQSGMRVGLWLSPVMAGLAAVALSLFSPLHGRMGPRV